MKFIHWFSILLCLAVPYGGKGLLASVPGGAAQRRVAALSVEPVYRLDRAAPADGRSARAPIAQQATGGIRHRSAFPIPSFRPDMVALTVPRSGASVGRAFKQFSDDIFHPPA